MNVAIIHLFYPELVDEVINKTLELPVEKIIATTCSESILKSVTEKNIDILQISLVENKGMDIGPFLLSLDKVPDNCKYIYKLHTKKDHKWRRELFDGLPMNPDDKVVYGSQTWVYKDPTFYKSDKIFKLCQMLGFEYPDKRFIAGTIFCIRKDILFKWIYDKRLDIYNLMEMGFCSDIEESTWTHSMERVLTCLSYLEKEILWDISWPDDFNGKCIFLNIGVDNSIVDYLSKFKNVIITDDLKKIKDSEKYFIFTFINNPVSRLITKFRQLENTDFNSFVDDIIDDNLLEKQSDIVVSNKINLISKIEDFEDSLEYIFEITNTEYVKYQKPFVKYDTINIKLKTKEKILKYYQSDFDRFDYKQ
jgi:hypothetical protein